MTKEIEMKQNLAIAITLLILTLFLSGCCGGGSETVVVSPEGSAGSATVGQQLQDLKAAHDQGAISDEEYEKQKEKILEAE